MYNIASTIKDPNTFLCPSVLSLAFGGDRTQVTVDTFNDLEYVRSLAASMNNWVVVPELAQVIRLIDGSRLAVV